MLRRTFCGARERWRCGVASSRRAASPRAGSGERGRSALRVVSKRAKLRLGWKVWPFLSPFRPFPVSLGPRFWSYFCRRRRFFYGLSFECEVSRIEARRMVSRRRCAIRAFSCSFAPKIRRYDRDVPTDSAIPIGRTVGNRDTIGPSPPDFDLSWHKSAAKIKRAIQGYSLDAQLLRG